MTADEVLMTIAVRWCIETCMADDWHIIAHPQFFILMRCSYAVDQSLFV
jgi:hypothetical protein